MHASFLVEMSAMLPARHLAALVKSRHCLPMVEQTRHLAAFAGGIRHLTVTRCVEGGRHQASRMAHLRHLAGSGLRWLAVAIDRFYRLMALGEPSRGDWRDWDAQQMKKLLTTLVVGVLPRDASHVR